LLQHIYHFYSKNDNSSFVASFISHVKTKRSKKRSLLGLGRIENEVSSASVGRPHVGVVS